MKGAHPDRPEWNETLEFVVPVTELPRSAKLCILIYQQKQAGGRKRKEVQVAGCRGLLLNLFITR